MTTQNPNTMNPTKKHIMYRHAIIEIVQETEKAYLLENVDKRTIRAWVPKSALEEVRNVSFHNGIIATRCEIKDWFFKKTTMAHSFVFGTTI